MEDKIVGTSEDEKRFLQISMDPSDNTMQKANVRFINIDDVKQAVIIGPVTHSLVGIDLNQPEIVIDETLKCQRLFRPKIRKVKTSFFAQIRWVSNTLMPSEGVSGYIPVR